MGERLPRVGQWRPMAPLQGLGQLVRKAYQEGGLT
jgi:hypothetical protein